MDTAQVLRTARQRAGLTQQALAARAGTSQATLSAYETGRKTPSVETLTRLLAATGSRLSIEPAARPVVQVSDKQLRKAGRTLVQALDLAAALPARRKARLRFPHLAVRGGRAA